MQLNKNEQLVISKISHELRNPLTIIYSTLQLIESRHPEARTFDHWHELMQDVEFMSVLLDDLSRFNHAGALNFSTFSFRPFLGIYLPFFRRICRGYKIGIFFQNRFFY